MRNLKDLWKKLLLLLVLGGWVALTLSRSSSPPKQTQYVTISRQNGTVETVDLESYVIGVVAAEMPASFELEALKAQAVASRTYVMSRQLQVDDTTSSQVYYDQKQRQENWQGQYEVYESKITQAVQETAAEVMTYNGAYISALFFSSCNGRTENNEDYFASASVPYLQSVDSSWDLSFAGTYREKTFSLEELNKLFGTSDFTMDICRYHDSGYVATVDVCGTIYTGREIREKLGLASSAFSLIPEGDQITFATVGYGHGVGMSQYGANGMALEGYTYQEILAHYYQGVTIEKIP